MWLCVCVQRPLPPCPPPGESDNNGLPRQLHSYVYDPRDNDSPPTHAHHPRGFHLQLCPQNRRAAYRPVDPNGSPSRGSLGSEADSAPYHVYDYISDTDSVRYRGVRGHEYAYCTCSGREGPAGPGGVACTSAPPDRVGDGFGPCSVVGGGECFCVDGVVGMEGVENLTVNTSNVTTNSSSSGHPSSSALSSLHTTPRQSEGYHSDHDPPALQLLGLRQHEISKPYPRYPHPGTATGTVGGGRQGSGVARTKPYNASRPGCGGVNNNVDDDMRQDDLEALGLGMRIGVSVPHPHEHFGSQPSVSFNGHPNGRGRPADFLLPPHLARTLPRYHEPADHVGRGRYPLPDHGVSGLRGLPAYSGSNGVEFPGSRGGRGGTSHNGGGRTLIHAGGNGGFFNDGLVPADDLGFADPPPPYHDVCPLSRAPLPPPLHHAPASSRHAPPPALQRRGEESGLRFVNVPGGTLESESESHECEYPQTPTAVNGPAASCNNGNALTLHPGYFTEQFDNNSTTV